MSSARCLNWSRPPPGRHPGTTTTAAAAAVLRKQVSCIEPTPSHGSLDPPGTTGGTGHHRPSTVNTLSNAPVQQQQQQPPPADGCDHFCQFLVTGAIIHTNRFQNYHTYNQAHRGTSGTSGSVTPLGYHHQQQQQQQHPSLSQRRRPSSASASGAPGGGSIVDPAPGDPTGRTRLGRRAILCKQLSLDQSILVAATAASSIASGMAAVANGAGDGQPDGSSIVERGWSFGRKQTARIGSGGAGMKTDMDSGTKKGPKAPGKDSRINIKIFLGQTVQQDSSDTGISDTEAPTPSSATTATAAASLQKSDSTPAMSSTAPTEPYSTFTGSKGNKAAATAVVQASSTSSGSQSSSSSGTVGSGTTSSTSTATNSGRSSSLAQRRAQFQANRQNSEAHDRRHPPLVRAMSAPIRPADPDTSKFLQSKKKPRRRKVLREKDEYNICEEDEYSDEGGNLLCSSGSTALSANGTSTVGKGSTASSGNNGGLPLRSRSVLGGACDIETLVSLLSSGGSDSEKEQEHSQSQNTVPSASGSATATSGHGVASSPASFRQPFITSAHLVKSGRAPMLKKTGKSVSFQESDLKPPPVANAGLNRDYRKPTFQPTTVANRVRRAVHTLNAFQLKDREKSDEKELNEEKCATDWLTREKDQPQSPQDSSSPSTIGEHQAAKQPGGTAGGAGGKTGTETTGGKSSTGAIVGTNGELLQSPKEQECYRLYLKMSKKGLAVSYDTILRGMLTPTELRVLQKKQSRNQQPTDGGPKDENVIGSEDDMLSPGENGPLSIAITDPSLFPLPTQTATTNAGGLDILTIPEEPAVIEHEIKASDSDGGGGGAGTAIAADVS